MTVRRYMASTPTAWVFTAMFIILPAKPNKNSAEISIRRLSARPMPTSNVLYNSAAPMTTLRLPNLATSQPQTEIGRAHVLTPVTNAQPVCRLLLDKKKQQNHYIITTLHY